MKNKLKKEINKYANSSIVRFLIVGTLNTIIGTMIMFMAYNILHFNYWLSSATNYIFTSILSYFLNKYFTFKNTIPGIKPIIKFILNIAICYFIAYGIARPFISALLSYYDPVIQDNGAMLIGMCLFVILNYMGQRFFAFKK